MGADIGAMGEGTPSFTPEFEYLSGLYSITDSALPYFNISLRVSDALRFLYLPRDVVFDPSEPIALEELFQRELNEQRVKDKLVPYLKSPEKVKFFNSLTVALFPRDTERGGRFRADFPPAVSRDSDEQFVYHDLGPVRIRQLKGNANIGYIAWEYNDATAVVLDGQHRLYGLKLLTEDQTFRRPEELRNSKIPVIIVLPHVDLGYRAPAGAEDTSLLATYRTVFIDLNKHSVKVSPDRQYLLDDLDVYAVSMRSILEPKTGGVSSDPVEDRVSATGRLPLALVDWHSGAAKFEKGSESYYLTSTLIMYDHVGSGLSLPSYGGSDYEGAKRFMDRLVARLNLEERDPALKDQLEVHYQNCKSDLVPFSLLESHVSQLGAHFRDVLGPVIVEFLTGAKPYKELISAYEGAGLLAGEFETWLALDQVGKSAFPVEKERERPAAVANRIAYDIKGKYPLAYQVVFQRAFIDVLFSMYDNREELAEELSWRGGGPEFLEDALRRFNDVVVPYLWEREELHSWVWVGGGLKANRTIDFSKASQKAIGGLTACAFLAPVESFQDAAEAAEWVDERIQTGPKSDAVSEIVSGHGKSWKARLASVLKDEYRARDKEPPEKSLLEQEAVERAGEVLFEMGREK